MGMSTDENLQSEDEKIHEIARLKAEKELLELKNDDLKIAKDNLSHELKAEKEMHQKEKNDFVHERDDLLSNIHRLVHENENNLSEEEKANFIRDNTRLSDEKAMIEDELQEVKDSAEREKNDL